MRIVANQPGVTRIRAFTDDDPVVFDATPDVTATHWAGEPVTAVVGDGVAGVWPVTVACVAPGRVSINFDGVVGGSAWGQTIEVDVVSSRLFDLGELSDLPGMERARWSVDAKAAARDWVERQLELFLSTSVVRAPHVERGLVAERVSRGGGLRLAERYPVEVVAVVADGTPVDVSVARCVGDGVVRGVDVSGATDVEVRMLRGAFETPPADLSAVCAQWAAHLVAASGDSAIPRRAVSVTNDLESFRLATASAARPSGIPDIDAVLVGWRDVLRPPGVA